MSYPIGTKFKTGGKAPRDCIITDIHTTLNSKGEVVKIRYVATHEFMGQTITDLDVCPVIVARGFGK